MPCGEPKSEGVGVSYIYNGSPSLPGCETDAIFLCSRRSRTKRIAAGDRTWLLTFRLRDMWSWMQRRSWTPIYAHVSVRSPRLLLNTWRDMHGSCATRL